MIKLPGGTKIECDAGLVSDGYHTFDELYVHRCALFVALANTHVDISWKSLKHSDGSSFAGWFIAGMHLPTGDITYHLPIKMWDLILALALESAPEWDGHTSADVLSRINSWVELGSLQ